MGKQSDKGVLVIPRSQKPYPRQRREKRWELKKLPVFFIQRAQYRKCLQIKKLLLIKTKDKKVFYYDYNGNE